MRSTGPYVEDDFRTRGKRRNAIKAVVSCLSSIRDAEKKYLDNTPDNFQISESFEVGENAVDALDEIIDMLADVY